MNDTSDDDTPLSRMNKGKPLNLKYRLKPNDSTRPIRKKTNIKCGRCKKSCATYNKYISHSCAGPTTFCCDLCKRTYFSLKRLVKHIESHSQSEPKNKEFTCDLCGQKFHNRSKMQIHVLGEHFNLNFQCDGCSKRFLCEENLARHRCGERKILTCPECGETFTQTYQLKKHYLALDSHSAWKCRYCPSIFLKVESYNTHISKLSCSKSARNDWLNNFDPRACRVCGDKYSNEDELIGHFKNSHSGDPHQCYWCETQLANMEDLKLHVHHHNVEKYTCHKCDVAYTSQEGYRKHKLKHQKLELKCEFCGKQYLSSRRANSHAKKCKLNPSLDGPTSANQNVLPTKQPRQLNWESRIIVRKVRGVPDEEKSHNSSNMVGGFEIDDDSLSDRQGWFDDYYSTADDHISPPPVDEFLPSDTENATIAELRAVSSNSEDSSEGEDDEVKEEIDFNHKQCRICGLTCSLEYELLHHFVKNHPGEIPHQCPHCKEQSPLFARLKEHMKIHGIGLGVFHCGSCSKAFTSEARGFKHAARCRGDAAVWPRSKTCRHCGKIFQTKCGYKRHKKTSCKGGKKTTVSVLKEETIIQSDGESWFVNEPDCEEVAEEVNIGNLEAGGPEIENTPKPEETHFTASKKNVVIPPPKDKFPCRLCSSKFSFERGLVMHFKSDHPGIKPLICPECGIALADKLKEHLKTHGIGEEFVCELCGKRFNQKFLSKIHEMWHEGIEYKCTNCKQRFLTEQKMSRHISAGKCSNRQSLMKLPCDVCGRFYRSQFGLKTHYLTHTPRDLRPVKNRVNCEFCGKWFQSNNALERHRRIHTGEKPFCCRYCPKAFAQEGNCKAHERLHTGESKPRKKKIEQVVEKTVPIYFCVSAGDL